MKNVLVVLCLLLAFGLTGCITGGLDKDFVSGSQEAYDTLSETMTTLLNNPKLGLSASVIRDLMQPLHEWKRLIDQAWRALGED